MSRRGQFANRQRFGHPRRIHVHDTPPGGCRVGVAVPHELQVKADVADRQERSDENRFIMSRTGDVQNTAFESKRKFRLKFFAGIRSIILGLRAQLALPARICPGLGTHFGLACFFYL